MNKNILGIIPARGGSKNIPNKNLAWLNGKPLIQYTIDAAKNSKFISRLILSSDSDEIMEYCKDKNVEVPFKRPVDIAGDSTPMIEVVKHALEFLKKEENYAPDIIVILQPTSPLRRVSHIDEALEQFMNSGADSLVSVIEVPHQFNPYSVMKYENNWVYPFMSYDEKKNTRQLKPKFFARNGPAILAFTYDCISNKDSMYGEKIIPYLMKKENSIDIDDLTDLKIAEYIMKTKTDE
jgi:N-acylneuraminate cytidylyltransferase